MLLLLIFSLVLVYLNYVLHTDQGRDFESHLFQHICELLGVHKTRTSPYKPQSDGLVERFNRTLQQMLASYVNGHRNDWDDHLPYMCTAYRSTVHESTKFSPNRLMLGREVNLPLDVMVGAPPSSNTSTCYVQYVEWVKNAVWKSFAAAHEHSKKAAERQNKIMISPFHPMMIFKYMIGCGTFTLPGQGKSLDRDGLNLF